MHYVRNHFAFHYAPDKIKLALADLEEPTNLTIYLSEQTGNTYYQFSETIVNSAMLDGIKKGDYEAAVRKLMKQVTAVAGNFISFADAWLTFVLPRRILSRDHRSRCVGKGDARGSSLRSPTLVWIILRQRNREILRRISSTKLKVCRQAGRRSRREASGFAVCGFPMLYANALTRSCRPEIVSLRRLGIYRKPDALPRCRKVTKDSRI